MPADYLGQYFIVLALALSWGSHCNLSITSTASHHVILGHLCRDLNQAPPCMTPPALWSHAARLQDLLSHTSFMLENPVPFENTSRFFCQHYMATAAWATGCLSSGNSFIGICLWGEKSTFILGCCQNHLEIHSEYDFYLCCSVPNWFLFSALVFF